MAVGVVQRGCHFAGNAQRVPDGELALALESLPKRLTLDERHHIVEEPIRRAGVEERQDVGMLEVRRRLDLGQEPLGADHGGQLWAQHLEGHPPVMPQVLSQVDDRHAALAQLALEHVTLAQGRSDAVAHYCSTVRMTLYYDRVPDEDRLPSPSTQDP